MKERLQLGAAAPLFLLIGAPIFQPYGNEHPRVIPVKITPVLQPRVTLDLYYIYIDKSYMHAYIPTYVRTYVHTYINTYIHTYLISHISHIISCYSHSSPHMNHSNHRICGVYRCVWSNRSKWALKLIPQRESHYDWRIGEGLRVSLSSYDFFFVFFRSPWANPSWVASPKIEVMKLFWLLHFINSLKLKLHKSYFCRRLEDVVSFHYLGSIFGHRGLFCLQHIYISDMPCTSRPSRITLWHFNFP